MATRHPDRFSVVHVLSAQDDWRGERGRISGDLVKRHLLRGEGIRMAAVCGPNAFTDAAAKMLEGLGMAQGEIALFQG